MRLPISAYIRTLNEERRIGDVIRAAQELCDEIIVVDSSSTDKTVEISKTLGAKVIHQPWLGHGKQKRVGEKSASHDWVMGIDADEVISETLADDIRQHFASPPPNHSLFFVYVTTIPPIGKMWKTFGGAWRVKIYNRTYVRMPDHKRWDQFENPQDSRKVRLKGPLLHYSFKNIAHLLRKQNTVSSASADAGKLKPYPYVVLRIFVGLPFYFFKAYILRRMFLAGIYGFGVALTTSYGRWLKDIKMYEKHKGLDVHY